MKDGVRCPHCTRKVAEYISGNVEMTCRHCKRDLVFSGVYGLPRQPARYTPGATSDGASDVSLTFN